MGHFQVETEIMHVFVNETVSFMFTNHHKDDFKESQIIIPPGNVLKHWSTLELRRRFSLFFSRFAPVNHLTNGCKTRICLYSNKKRWIKFFKTPSVHIYIIARYTGLYLFSAAFRFEEKCLTSLVLSLPTCVTLTISWE